MHPQAFLPVSCLEGGPHSTDSSNLDVVNNDQPNRDVLGEQCFHTWWADHIQQTTSFITLWSGHYVHIPMIPEDPPHWLMMMFLVDPSLIALSELENYQHLNMKDASATFNFPDPQSPYV